MLKLTECLLSRLIEIGKIQSHAGKYLDSVPLRELHRYLSHSLLYNSRLLGVVVAAVGTAAPAQSASGGGPSGGD